MHFFYNKEETLRAKEKLGKYSSISEIWRKKYAPSNRIGNCSNLFRLHKPKDENDFFEKYFRYAENNTHLPISQRGLTHSEFKELVKNYMDDADKTVDEQFSYEIYLNDCLCHIITETFSGKIQEMNFIAFLESLGYKCSFFDGKTDAKYGLDIKVTRHDGRVSAIQIKPLSFFKSNRSDVQKDRINLCVKYEETLRIYNIKTYYAIYYKDKETGEVLWLKNGNGYRFKIDELFNYDHNDIQGTFVRKPLIIDLHTLGK